MEQTHLCLDVSTAFLWFARLSILPTYFLMISWLPHKLQIPEKETRLESPANIMRRPSCLSFLNRLFGNFPNNGRLLGEVCAVQGRVFWRRLRFQTSRWVVIFSADPPYCIFFCLTFAGRVSRLTGSGILFSYSTGNCKFFRSQTSTRNAVHISMLHQQ